MASAEHQLQMAQARLLQASGGAGVGQALTQRGPIDGVVFKRLRESEAVVPAGEPLVEIGDPRQLEIVSDLLSTDAVKVKPGSPVLLEQWGGDGPLRARVRRVEPSGFMKVSALGVEEQRVNPLEAWAVFAVRGGRAEMRVAEVGRRKGTEAEARSDLREGKRVVLHPSDTLSDGTHVTPRPSRWIGVGRPEAGAS